MQYACLQVPIAAGSLRGSAARGARRALRPGASPRRRRAPRPARGRAGRPGRLRPGRARGPAAGRPRRRGRRRAGRPRAPRRDGPSRSTCRRPTRFVSPARRRRRPVHARPPVPELRPRLPRGAPRRRRRARRRRLRRPAAHPGPRAQRPRLREPPAPARLRRPAPGRRGDRPRGRAARSAPSTAGPGPPAWRSSPGATACCAPRGPRCNQPREVALWGVRMKLLYLTGGRDVGIRGGEVGPLTTPDGTHPGGPARLRLAPARRADAHHLRGHPLPRLRHDEPDGARRLPAGGERPRPRHPRQPLHRAVAAPGCASPSARTATRRRPAACSWRATPSARAPTRRSRAATTPPRPAPASTCSCAATSPPRPCSRPAAPATRAACATSATSRPASGCEPYVRYERNVWRDERCSLQRPPPPRPALRAGAATGPCAPPRRAGLPPSTATRAPAG